MAIHILAMMLLLGLLLTIQAAGQAGPPLAKPGCKEDCGGVAIHFPFGIGPGCFLDEWYEIDCRNGSTLPVPFLKKSNLEVVTISPWDYSSSLSSIMQVNYPIISNASCAGNGTGDPVSLKGSPFSFYDGSVTVVGCNVHALVSGSDIKESGCRSGCDGDYSFYQNGTCSMESSCCQISLPTDFQEFKVEFMEGGESNCSYALLADADLLQSGSLEDFVARKSVIKRLSWGIRANQSIARLTPIDGGSYYTGADYSFWCEELSLPGIVSCDCNAGCLGNPYLEGGCVGACRYNYRGNKKKWTRPVIAIGSALGGILLLSVVWGLYKFIRRWRELILKKKNFKRNGGLLLEQQLNSPEGSIEKSKIFSSTELEIATENFNRSRILGRGGQGTVYKGMLTDGRIVAIKRSTVVDEGKLEQFINEVVILSLINHRNIVNLLGCCLETEVPLLVYEFIPNGTLYQYLHDPNEEFPVTWETRLRIATEVVGALAYLHSAASLPIYHRDIKSGNILLDEKYRAKVADFGTSKSVSLDQTHVTTLVRGTFGYLDPEYFQSSQFTDKSDVYSFGVLLVELLTGQKPVSSNEEREGRSLATYFIVSMDESSLFEIIDPEVMNQGREEEISRVALLAKRCLCWNGRNRPSMKEVAAELEEVRNIAVTLRNQGSNIGAATEHDDDFSTGQSDAESAETEPSVNQLTVSITTSW